MDKNTSGGTPQDCVKFLETVGKLKHLPRTGWVKCGVPGPETVAGHMYRMSVAAMMFGPEDGVDPNKVMRMCVVHDLAESEVGDITPHCGVTKEDKAAREAAAMAAIARLPPPSAGREMVALFEEYEAGESPEARLAHDLDKYDMILQAFEYEQREGRKGWLQQFFDSTKGVCRHPKVVQWVEEVYRRRAQQ